MSGDRSNDQHRGDSEGRQEPNESERRDILPIVYDVQAIPTIGTMQTNRGRQMSQSQRPLISIPATRRNWPPRGGTRGSRGGGPPIR